MKTASHFTFFGPGRIVISRGLPRGNKTAGYRMFKALAPTRDILGIEDREEYKARYDAEVLGVLDPQETWDKLHELANGYEPVLQCFEKPPLVGDNWCHRTMVAEWFKRTLGHDVTEIGDEPASCC